MTTCRKNVTSSTTLKQKVDVNERMHQMATYDDNRILVHVGRWWEVSELEWCDVMSQSFSISISCWSSIPRGRIGITSIFPFSNRTIANWSQKHDKYAYVTARLIPRAPAISPTTKHQHQHDISYHMSITWYDKDMYILWMICTKPCVYQHVQHQSLSLNNHPEWRLPLHMCIYMQRHDIRYHIENMFMIMIFHVHEHIYVCLYDNSIISCTCMHAYISIHVCMQMI